MPTLKCSWLRYGTGRQMGLDIFFLEDIRNALLAADHATSSTAKMAYGVRDDEELPEVRAVALKAYMEGYRAALVTIALSFGLSPAILTQGRRELAEAMRLLLEARGQVGKEADSLEGEEDVVHIVPDRVWE